MYANRNAKDVIFPIGDPVYYRNHTRKSKLDRKWKTYFRIIEQTSPVTYIIKHQLNGSTTKVHAQHLRLANVNDWDIPKVDTGRKLRAANYVVSPVAGSSSDSDLTDNNNVIHGTKFLRKRYRRGRSDSSSEDDIPLAELRDIIRKKQSREKSEEKALTAQYVSSSDSYFSDDNSGENEATIKLVNTRAPRNCNTTREIRAYHSC